MVCGIVLAAGAGTRFGSLKQLAPLDGVPLLQHAIDVAVSAGDLDRVVVVLGAGAPEVAAAVDPGRARLVVCPDWSEGMSASLRAGIAACPEADWVVITLGDEPALPAAAIERVVAVARQAPSGVLAIRSSWNGRPGHPVALSAVLAAQAGSLEGDVGARALMPDDGVLAVEMGDLGESADVDTPSDLPAAR